MMIMTNRSDIPTQSPAFLLAVSTKPKKTTSAPRVRSRSHIRNKQVLDQSQCTRGLVPVPARSSKKTALHDNLLSRRKHHQATTEASQIRKISAKDSGRFAAGCYLMG